MLDLTGYTLDLTTPLPKDTSKEAKTFENVTYEDLALLEAKGFVKRGDSLTLICPTDGATTESVKRTRLEFKFHDPIFMKDFKRFVARIKADILEVNHEHDIVLLQLHCDDGNDPTIKGFYSDGYIKVGVRDFDSKTKKVGKTDLLKVGYGELRDLVLSFEIEGNRCTVSAGFGVASNSLTFEIPDKRLARPHVPHFGIYNQADKDEAAVPKGDRSVVVVHEFSAGEAAVLPPVEEEPSLYEVLDAELDYLRLMFAQGHYGKGAAKLELVKISERIKTVEDKDQRLALNTKAGAIKLELA